MCFRVLFCGRIPLKPSFFICCEDRWGYSRSQVRMPWFPNSRDAFLFIPMGYLGGTLVWPVPVPPWLQKWSRSRSGYPWCGFVRCDYFRTNSSFWTFSVRFLELTRLSSNSPEGVFYLALSSLWVGFKFFAEVTFLSTYPFPRLLAWSVFSWVSVATS